MSMVREGDTIVLNKEFVSNGFVPRSLNGNARAVGHKMFCYTSDMVMQLEC